jgi:hypothetical protein
MVSLPKKHTNAAQTIKPQTVNVDGWDATQAAWQRLFPTIVVMRCFLPVVLGIQQCCRLNKALWQSLSHELWHLFHSLNPAQFGQRLRRLLEWSATHPDSSDTIHNKLQNLKPNAANFKLTFTYPDAYRTSNTVDRLMNFQDRLLYAMQYFHGSAKAARAQLRVMAMLWNFHPYTRKVQQCAPFSRSPSEDLNGFRYHGHWLRNLLIASSLNGRNTGNPRTAARFTEMSTQIAFLLAEDTQMSTRFTEMSTQMQEMSKQIL